MLLLVGRSADRSRDELNDAISFSAHMIIKPSTKGLMNRLEVYR